MKSHEQGQGASAFPYEVLTTAELAQRLKVKESWVVDQSKRSRTADPIPIFRLGKHRRYLGVRQSLTLGSLVAAESLPRLHESEDSRLDDRRLTRVSSGDRQS